jgi:hypothetical protein
MDAPTVTVTSSAAVTAVTVNGVTSFFAPTIVAQTAALITPVVIDGQTSFPEPELQTDSTISAAAITPPAATMDAPGLQSGTGTFVNPGLIAPPGPTMGAPSLSTSSVVAIVIIETGTVIYIPTIRAANRFPKYMSLKKTRTFHYSTA